MSNSWYFHYQVAGKESRWDLALSSERERIVAELRPAFTTILDLTSVPDDGDWSKVKYRGAFYVDFDSDDLAEVCEQTKNFLAKINMELGFDLSQARYYATGGRGFHIEIPEACFRPKVPTGGTVWLPYIYRAMAESLYVDTLDLNIFTGKRGRQWRTVNVQRDNGMFKVPLSLDEILTIDPDAYADLIKAPRDLIPPVAPSLNTKFAMCFERSKTKVTTSMRGRKKRLEKANALLAPWKKANATPPTIAKIMAGEHLADNAGFQAIAMQLAIYATHVGLDQTEFLKRCEGVCKNHVSDSRRYNTFEKRQSELSRMWEYFATDDLYEFDTGPVVRLLKPGTDVSDLGVMITEDVGDTPTATPGETPAETPNEDPQRSIRRSVFMNADGIWKRSNDNYECLCRATLRQVESFYDAEKGEFKGFEFDIVATGRRTTRTMLAHDAFISASAMKKFFAAHQISFQGGDSDVSALLDIMSEKAAKGGRVYVYPREGFFIMNNPESEGVDPVKIYLTQDTFLSSLDERDEKFFQLRYRPTQATSAYNLDIHKAPKLDESMIPALHDLFNISKPSVVADLVGWFVAAHYRSVYLYLFHQFPLLQIYGEAGAGKTQTVLLLAHLHWHVNERISVKSATSCTPFAMDMHASSSTSAPFIMDEYKPRELRSHKGKYEKLKDVLKASYVGADVGERGTLNKGAETHLAIVKSKAVAPIVFMGEAVEMETAIIERSVTVALSKSIQSRDRAESFLRLQTDPTPLSALGRAIVEMGFALDLDAVRSEVRKIQAEIEAGLPDFDDENRRRVAPRLIYNRAVILHALLMLKRVLNRHFGDEFDADIAALTERPSDTTSEEARAVEMHAMSEISKVISRLALMSGDRDKGWEIVLGKDYIVGPDWIEIRAERAYDKYRIYCATVRDTPLFDTVDAFLHALNSYSPCIDRLCLSSELREMAGNTERIMRLSVAKLRKEGVQEFHLV